ncbi:MAG: hypothetical protein GF329_12320, partial [Candidatus Lokiarchaeota archaeon]|nr:hypothetical protein [Candidatus Lokiarchaeota archaeon]
MSGNSNKNSNKIIRRLTNKAFLLILGGFIISIILGHLIIPFFVPIAVNSDTDYIERGPYKGDLLISEFSRVVIWNVSDNKIDWEYTGDERGLYFIHDADIISNGNLMITDTINDRLIEVNMTTKN